MSLLTLLSSQSATSVISANRIESTSQVFNPTITPGAVSISADLLTNTSVFYNATVSTGSSPQTITADLFTNTSTVYNPTVSAASSPQTITADLFTNTSSFYSATVTPGASLIDAALLTNNSVVFAPTVAQLVDIISADLFTNASVVYAPTLTGGTDKLPDTSDILDRNLKRARKEEEQIAAQILKSRQKPEPKKAKKATQWKALLLKQIEDAQTVEEVQAVEIPLEAKNVSAKVVLTVEEAKAKRLAQIQQLEMEVAEKLAESIAAQKAAEDFTRKRNNRIKRLKALMWLAKLDL